MPFLQHILDVPGLGIGNDLHGWIVRYQREIGIERRGGLADRTAYIGKGGLVIGLGGGEDFRFIREIGDDLAVFVTMIDRPGFGGEVDDLPALAVLFKQQIDEAHMRAPETGHDSRLAHQRALDRICTLNAVPGLRTGENEMLVAGEDGVDAFDGSEIKRGVFHALGLALAIDTGMGKGDDDISAFFLHDRNPGFRCLDDITRLGLALEVLGIPHHDLRRHEADDADLDRARHAAAIADLLFQNDIGLEEQLVVFRIGSKLALGEVGADVRETRAGQRVRHIVEAVIEFVVAERAAIITQHIHGIDHGVLVAGLHAALIGDIVAERITLQEVAIIHQHRVTSFGTDGVDDRGGAGQPHRVVRLVGVIIIGKDMNMDVSRFHDAQMRLVGRCARSKRVQQHQRRGGRDAAQKRTPGDGVESEKRRHGNSFE
ncbi:hypothetical protein D3C87_874950 [compost metagenome]